MSLVPLEPPQPPAWVAVMGPAAELAKQLNDTEFVPARLRKRPAAVLACILAGDEAGIGPMQSLRQIFVTDDGKVGQSAELMRALVLRAGHEIWVQEYTNTRVTMSGRRRGQENPSSVTWTLDDAKRANLAGKQNWTKYPRAMLTARATSELCRLVFADVIAGISYSTEELQDGIDDVDDPPETPDAPKTTTRRAPVRKAAAAAAAPKEPARGSAPTSAPSLPPLPGDEDSSAPAAPPTNSPPGPAAPRPGELSTAQRIAMRAKEVGIDDHHKLVHAVMHGTKTKASDLTGDEAAEVLTAISGIKDGRLLFVDDPGGWHHLQPIDPDTGEITDDGVEDAEIVEPIDVADWTEATWRSFIAEKGVRFADLLREAHRIAPEYGVAPPTTLEGLARTPALASALVVFVEEQHRQGAA